MIIGNFNVICVAAAPNKAQPELLVQPDRPLPGPVALQLFEPVGRRHAEIGKFGGRVKLGELSLRPRQQIGGKPLESNPRPQCRNALVLD